MFGVVMNTMRHESRVTSNPAPPVRTGVVNIPKERRSPAFHLQHGMEVHILGDDPNNPDRYIVQVAGEKPRDVSKALIRERQ